MYIAFYVGITVVSILIILVIVLTCICTLGMEQCNDGSYKTLLTCVSINTTSSISKPSWIEIQQKYPTYIINIERTRYRYDTCCSRVYGAGYRNINRF